MKIRLEDRLPFVTVSVFHEGREISLDRVLLDTGSAGSVFSVDEVSRLGIVPGPTDILRRVVGVGGAEFVITKRVEKLALGEIEISGFAIQIGAMDYGFPIQGLLGLDFLLRSSAVIDLGEMEIYGSSP
ncbi:MAG TPA: retropepsin-like aspartic protease [Thermoanaerobaculia bacterium]|nr:retropepsin-like aspartic protease [Thermoanaerobaculia bacterium]